MADDEKSAAEIGSLGGKARAASMTSEERSAQARNAVLARWKREGVPDIPMATHGGLLALGNAEVQCYVLDDGTRILSTRGVMKAIGRSWEGRRVGGKLPSFLSAKNFNQFITSDLEVVLSHMEFRASGGRAEGFRAEVLPKICEVYLKARDAGVLTGPQERVAKQAEMLMRALAHTGIIALVDEATGYQEIRDRFALQEILDRYLRKEFAVWASQFPDTFYKEIFRLRGWKWKGMKINRPQCVAQYTKDIVYARLAPDLLRELESRNPTDENGRRKAKHYYWLTEDIGHPALAQHLHAVIGLMRASEGWEQFKKMLNRAFPKRTMQLELFGDESDRQ